MEKNMTPAASKSYNLFTFKEIVRDTGKTALIIIDIQNDYFQKGGCPLIGSEAASEKAKQLLDFFREKKYKIIHIQHEKKAADATFFVPGTEGQKIHKNTAPLQGEKVFTKYVMSSFAETGLDSYLKENNIESLVLCGMQTDHCLQSAAADAYNSGYRIIIAQDTAAAKSLAAHESTLKVLGEKYAKLMNAAEIITSFTKL